MRNVIIRNGRYIQKEVDLGPVPPASLAEQLKAIKDGN